MGQGEAVRPELVSALTRGAGIKSLAGIDIGSQLTPVIVVDDFSRGPFPPSRIWHAGLANAAVAANIVHIGVANLDAVGRGSSLVVDYIIVRTNPIDDLTIVVGQYSASQMNVNVSTLRDRANESGGGPLGSAFDPQLGNGQVGAFVNAVGLNGAPVPYQDTKGFRIEGPWTLGPLAALYVRHNTVNVSIAAYFSGRYYAGV